PQAAMTKPSLVATHHTSSTFFAFSLSMFETYPGTCLAEQVGVKAPGSAKTTIFLPLVASPTLTSLGGSGQAASNSTDSDSLPSGSRSPTLMVILDLLVEAKADWKREAE